MAILSGEEGAKFFPSGVKKVNPAGVDLVPIGVFSFPGKATSFLKGSERGFLIGGKFVGQDAAMREILPDKEGFYDISPGLCQIRLPKVRIPSDVTGLPHPRSTMGRLGILKGETAVWDSGYEGEGVQNFLFILPARIHKDEAWVQMVFLRNESTSGSYSGHYQGEKRK